jgi:hypothetical protein
MHHIHVCFNEIIFFLQILIILFLPLLWLINKTSLVLSLILIKPKQISLDLHNIIRKLKFRFSNQSNLPLILFFGWKNSTRKEEKKRTEEEKRDQPDRSMLPSRSCFLFSGDFANHPISSPTSSHGKSPPRPPHQFLLPLYGRASVLRHVPV